MKHLEFVYRERGSLIVLNQEWINLSNDWSSITVPASHESKPIFVRYKGDIKSKHTPSTKSAVTAHILLAKSQFQEFSQRLYWAVEVFEEILPVKYEQLQSAIAIEVEKPG